MLSPKLITYIGLGFAVILGLMTVFLLVDPEKFALGDYKYQLQKKRKRGLENFALFINNAISTKTLGICYTFLTIVLALAERWHILGVSLMSIVFSSFVFRSLKRITQRSRPTDAKIQLFDYSFPSGHTTVGFVMLLSFAFLINQFLPEELKIYTYGLALLGGGIIGWTRRYLKVHRITDILGGILLGIGSFLAAYLFFFTYGDAIILAIESVFTSL